MNRRLMMRKNVLRNEKGFTLIEIIAVLVILGILAAVAVPKFMDMQATAEEQTLKVALNDMKSRAAMAFAKSMLANNGTAIAADQNGFSDLGFSTVADVDAAFVDFAGRWALTSDTVITYTLTNTGNYNTATFTLSPAGDATGPAKITLAFQGS